MKASIQKKRPKDTIRKVLPESFPTAVQKSYFMLADAERNVLNIGLQKYRAGQSEPILIGGEKMLKPALRLISDYRLRIDEIKGNSVVTSYTRWLESVETRGPENQEVYLPFSPRFERIWLRIRIAMLSLSTSTKRSHASLSRVSRSSWWIPRRRSCWGTLKTEAESFGSRGTRNRCGCMTSSSPSWDESLPMASTMWARTEAGSAWECP
jgi:hypothetical protein